jgi:dihydroorotate dehydrogenase subfamily 1
MVTAAALAYRLLYGGLLSRLPEASAVRIGQTLLRALPVDTLPLFTVRDPRLAITLGGVRLSNPVILAAMYYDPVILSRAMGLGFGAVTTKSITRQPRPGHPLPNLVRVRTAAGPGLVNCNGFQNPGLDAFLGSLGAVRRRVPLIVSVAGESEEDYADLVRAVGPHADLVELNISSPNTKLVYAWSTRPHQLRAALEHARRAARVPVIVKLSPDFPDENEKAIIPAALEAGIQVVNYGNARRVEEPRLSQGAGGLSGPEIFPATLDHVRRTRQRFGAALDIIGTGGVDDPDKALALLDAGATAVGYFTGFITRGPLLARRICERLLAARRC